MILGICLSLAVHATVSSDSVGNQNTFIPTQRFTLAWVHSIEKVRWEEDYAVEHVVGDKQSLVLRALAARVKGSAAGMEPGPDAVLREGWYEYLPAQRIHERLSLTRSFYTADYELCSEGICRPMHEFLRSDGGVTSLSPCVAAMP
jgi:hypothetical protein